MLQYASLIVIGSLLLTACASAAPAPRRRVGPDLKQTLAEAGLEYGGSRAFRTEKNNRRGDWKGAKPAFWTLTASTGAIKLRFELTKNITRAQAEKTMNERFQRIDALYTGGAAYPGMVTTEFEVPEALRPAALKAGQDGNMARALAATPNMTYGAGAEDLVSHRGVLGYVYCEKTSLLAQIELFYPKAEFRLETAIAEFGLFVCTGAGPAKAVNNRVKK